MKKIKYLWTCLNHKMIPKLDSNELLPLMDIRNSYPREFYTDQTKYLIQEMFRHAKQKMVFRISIMGITRGGKSEVGSTLGFWWVKIFNQCLLAGTYDDIDLFKEGTFTKQPITFSTEFVCDNQQVYKAKMKQYHNDKTLKWGQIWQIDEEKKSTGGVGSMSELLEMTNLNNIIAKFNQCEIWIQPGELESRNVTFGIHIIKKDEVNRVNWGLLYKPFSEPNGATIFKFMGWVKIPMHEHEDFRKEYNLLKNTWIAKELTGRADERSILRSECAEYLVDNHYELFEKTETEKRFKNSKQRMKIVLNNVIMKGEVTTNFNELEKDYIIEEACWIVDQILKNEKELKEQEESELSESDKSEQEESENTESKSE